MDHGNNQTRSAIPQAVGGQLNRGRIRRLLGLERRPLNVFGLLRMDLVRKLVDMFVCFVGNGEVERGEFGLRGCVKLPESNGLFFS